MMHLATELLLMHLLLVLALALGSCLTRPARAVIIDSGDGTGNTSAPAEDPGWAHVGARGGLTAIYLGNGWVLTANHVQVGDVTFDGILYPAVANSHIRLENDDASLPDLGVYRIDPSPELPILPIRATTPPVDTAVIMIGKGRNRGSATSWDPDGPAGPYDGYEWGLGMAMRWGTNLVEGFSRAVNTECFYTDFTEGEPSHEAQAATGDSGGAVFIENGDTWEIAGVLLAIGPYEEQPAETALYGNSTYAADLALYRDQIIAIARPECSDEVDNDGDDLIDFPDDPDCSDLSDAAEKPPPLHIPGWVTVGDPGNAPDILGGGYGSVGYVYQIREYEVTNAQYAEFLNAVAATDTYKLYSATMGTSSHGGISQAGSSGSFTYTTKAGMADKPVNYVSFYDALRFANWMHNSQPTGAQSSSTTEDGAYDLSLESSVARKDGAMIFLPSEDEWYKAAYYDAASSSYFDYPTGSDTQTSCTAPGAATNTANCDNAVGTVTDAGVYTSSASPAGTFDQGGNLREWSEALIGLNRVLRGGNFTDPSNDLAASVRGFTYPTLQYADVGFRVASIHEPGPELQLPTLVPWSRLALVGALIGAGMGVWQRYTSIRRTRTGKTPAQIVS